MSARCPTCGRSVPTIFEHIDVDCETWPDRSETESMKPPVTYDCQFIGHGRAGALQHLYWELLPWENREGAPRRECWFNPYGLPYTYGSGEYARTYQAHGFDGAAGMSIQSMIELLNHRYGASFDCCFVNGYAHGRQHLGWHADDSPEMAHEHPIAVVSLGAEREIWLRKTVPPTPSAEPLAPGVGDVYRMPLAHGSLLLMHAGMQREWQHRIPKSPVTDCGPRISLTFRKLVLS